MAPWVTLTALALLILLVAEYRRSRSLIFVSKPMASTGFIGAAITAGGFESAYGRAILVALALSWFGDMFLMSRRSSLFLAGLAAFLTAHVAYGVAFILHGQSFVWALVTLAVLAVPALLVARWLHPHVPLPMRKPVWAYILFITLMLSLAAGTRGAGGHFVILLGALCFYLSDISVARDRFIEYGFTNRLWGLPLYYGAQILLATSIARRAPFAEVTYLW
jgi:uncharacterized membrane protein YhhN